MRGNRSADDSKPAHWNFSSAIQSLSAANGGKGVVILIDEYDAPVGHSLDDLDKAFAQIREKGYAEPFKADTRPVWLIGLSFDSKTRHLVDFAAEELRAES